MIFEFFLSFIADPAKTLVSLRGVFYSSPLGQLLKPTFEDENIRGEAAMNYLNDFLHMIYKPIVEGELQVTTYVAKNGNCERVYDAGKN